MRFEVVKEKIMIYWGLEIGSWDNCCGFVKKMVNFEVNSINKILFMFVIVFIKRRGKIVIILLCVYFYWFISLICWFLGEKNGVLFSSF